MKLSRIKYFSRFTLWSTCKERMKKIYKEEKTIKIRCGYFCNLYYTYTVVSKLISSYLHFILFSKGVTTLYCENF